MAISDIGRSSNRPLAAYPNQSLQPETLPYESEPACVGIAGEDFLYHLSRGSELLKDNQIEPAKEALELALRMQPQDVRGQGLLGVTYFRLGLYPRAIQIYQRLALACPYEIAPKVNLALCYVKTGQHHAAKEVLEEVVSLEPGHARAYGYLGLVYQSLHEYGKAYGAFVSAGQPAMAERLRGYLDFADLEEGADNSAERFELRDVAEGACSAIESEATPFSVAAPQVRDSSIRPARWCRTEPGEIVAPESDRSTFRPSSPPTVRPSAFPIASSSMRPPPLPSVAVHSGLLGELLPPGATNAFASSPKARGNRLRHWFIEHWPQSAEGPVCKLDDCTLLVELRSPFAVRSDSVVSISPTRVARSERALHLPSTGGPYGASLGDDAPSLVVYEGPGRLIARASDCVLELVHLDGELLTIRESALLGFSLSLQYESFRLRFAEELPMEVLRLEGRGEVGLVLSSSPRALEVNDEGVVLRAVDLIGWTAGVFIDALDPQDSPGKSAGYRLVRGQGMVLLG